MSQTAQTPNVTIKLKIIRDKLFANSVNDVFGPITETKPIKISSGDIIEWRCVDDTIEKINNIKVDQESTDTSLITTDIWEDKPKKIDTAGKVFQAKVKQNMSIESLTITEIQYRSEKLGETKIKSSYEIE